MKEKIRVLYVDDESTLLDLCKMFLEHFGDFTVTIATGAPEALRILELATFDAIISDYQMPEMDGIEFLKVVRARGDKTPFIIFTGKGREEVVIEALNSGADFYIQKGGEPKSQFVELAHKIRRAVEHLSDEKSLQKSQVQLTEAMDLAHIANWEYDVASGIFTFNDRFYALYGTTAEREGGYQMPAEVYAREFVHPDEQRVVADEVQKAIAATDPNYTRDIEHRIIRRDGKIRHIIVRFGITKDAKGRTVKNHGANQDITNLKQVEENLRLHQVELEMQAEELRQAHVALEKSRDKYLDLYEFAPVGYLTLTDKGIITSVNLTGATLLGVVRSALIRAPLSKYIAENDSGPWYQYFRNVIKQDTQQTCTLTFTRGDGTPFPALLESVRLTGGEGAATVRMIISDNTEQKRAESEIQQLLANVSQEKEKLSLLINSISDEVWFADTEGRFTLANPSALREFRLDHADGFNVETLAKSLEVLRPDGSPRPVDEAPPLRALAGEVVRLQEEIVRTPATGELRYRQVSAAPVHNDKGIIMGSISVVRDITDLKRAEEALRKSEGKFQSLYMHMNEGAALHELTYNDQGIPEDYIIIETNLAFEKQLGISRDTVIGKTSREAYGVAEPPYFEIYARVALTGEPKVFETYFPPLKKHFSISVFCTQKGSFATVFEDITERKQVVETLRESEEKFRSIVETSPDIIWEIDPQGIFRYVSPNIHEVMGYTPEELIGRSITDMIPEEVKSSAIQELERQFSQRGPLSHFEMPSRHRDGREMILEIHPSLTGIDGKREGLRGIAVDITERKQAEESLRTTHEKYTKAFMSVPDAITISDLDSGRFIEVNDAATRIFGYSRDELIGKSTLELGIWQNKEDRDRLIDQVRKHGKVSQFEVLNRRKSGELYNALVNADTISIGNIPYLIAIIRDITDRKNAEAALAENEEKYRTLTANLPEIVYRVYLKENGRMQFFNDQVVTLTGYTEPELVAGTICSIEPLIHSEDRPRVVAAVEKAITEGGIFMVEYRLIHKDGSIRSFNERGRIIYGADNEPLYIDGMIQDVTERKKIDVALTESEGRYRALIDKLPDYIFVHTKDGVVYVNPAAVQALGYTKEELLTPPMFRFISSDSHQIIRDAIQQREEGVPINPYEIGVIAKDGTRHTCLVQGSRFIFNNAPSTLIVLTDITERKRVEEVLKKSEEQYRSLLEHVPELILVHRNGTILYTNPAAEKTLGYTSNEALNRNIIDFIAPEFHERVANAVRRRMEGVPVEPYEIDVIGKDGNRRTMSLNGTQIEFEGVPASLIVLVDITEQKALRDSVTLANKKLNLLSSITRHDIINQLSALNGYLELSRDLLNDPVKLAEFITKEQYIAGTIDDQIRFTKDYQDLGIHAPVWQNVHESVVMARESLPLRGIAVETNSPALEVYADPLLVRVFYNLIDNALRYGSDQMTAIRISSQVSSRGLMIVCEDDGVGIPADKKTAIFNRGYFKHTGFGLFLCREILSITGITITENGVPGKGARFEITVPEGAYRFTNTGEK
ncbi:MAG: PAS domain S-box protein [Dehalococcoidia bacterium]|jgi:PAS domain S-box-containing protein